MGIINVDFDATGQLLIIIFSVIIKYLKRSGNKMKQCISCVCTSTNSLRREVLYNILTGFGIAMKMVRLIKMWRVQGNQEVLKLYGIYQLLVYADDVNILVRSIHSIKMNAEAL
jgi:hypothetical protein